MASAERILDSSPDLREQSVVTLSSEDGEESGEMIRNSGGEDEDERDEMLRLEPGECVESDDEQMCDEAVEEGQIPTQEEATIDQDNRRKRDALDDTELGRGNSPSGDDRKRHRGLEEETGMTSMPRGAEVSAQACPVKSRLGQKPIRGGQGRYSTALGWNRSNLSSKMIGGHRPRQENTRFDTSTIQREFAQPKITRKPIGSDVLGEIIQKEPREAAILLEAQKGSVEAGLNENNMDDERQHLFWQVLAHISGDIEAAESVTVLLTIAIKSKLFDSAHLLRCLTKLRLSIQTESEQTRSLIKNVLTVFDAVLQRLPSHASDIHLAMTLLSDLADRAENDSDSEWKASVKELLNRLDAAEKDVERQRQVERYRQNPPPDDFRQQPILPTMEELKAGYKPYLRPNLTEGVYADGDHYLDVQFRLLKEDFVHPLRNGICEYLAFKRAHPNRRVKLQDIRIYEDVKFVEVLPETSGMSYRISFRKLDRVRWEHSKRFLHGSLLLLTDDDFNTFIFALVENRDMKDLEKGLVSISLMNQGDVSCLWEREFVAAECSVLFEAYRHVLSALQKMQSSLPLSKYILSLCRDVEAPKYLQHEEIVEDSPSDLVERNPIKVDVSALLTRAKRQAKRFINILDGEEWPAISDVNLDQSQYEAVKAALTKEISIIQGPPGTGKTYIGLKILETLLRNQEMLSRKAVLPILLVCYTNHALDQFLEGILEFHSNGIIRVGGRSKSDLLKPFNLRIKLKTQRKYQFAPQVEFIQCEVERVKRDMTTIQAKIEQSKNAILTEYELMSCMSEQHFNSLAFQNNLDDVETANESHIVQWLVPNRRRDRRRIVRTDCRTSEDYSIDPLFIGLNLNDPLQIENRGLINFIRSQISKEEGNKGRAKSYKHFLQKATNLWQMRSLDRWALYRVWIKTYSVEKKAQLAELGRKLEQLCSNLSHEKDTERCTVLRNAAVIGMTTTKAAHFQHVLQEVRPKIIVVEEAAEVLEAHVVTSLNASCQQLILIGDHQQLRPKPNVYELAKRYHLDLSLFERLINNQFPFTQLGLQHRMRPDISAIMRRHFYSQLQDHESVKSYGNVMGVEKNIFFLDHDEPEDFMEETRSHFNLHEVKFLVALCRYLLKQGYNPRGITILTAYTGQLLHLKQELTQRKIEGVRFASVDNYQGEENDIILLSFVRSNTDDQIGFLSISNRVCVSLSRAKKGLYCIGNFTLFGRKSEMWKGIVEDLKSSNFIGKNLVLQCHNHPEEKTEVSKSEDFENVPEGGCKEPCDTRLDCGHVCRYPCHPTDQDHWKYVCRAPCSKVVCERNHPCPMICSESCPTSCTRVTEKALACGHECTAVCWMPEESIVCKKLVGKTLSCSHVSVIPCYKSTEGVVCELVIEKMLKCGHTKTEKCNENGTCQEVVKTKLACDHICLARCSKNPSTIICRELVEKKLPCGHSLRIACSKDISDFPCKTILEKQLECGHKVIEECSKNTKCQKQVQRTLPCGHTRTMKCFADPNSYRCLARCQRKLPCGHICPEICAKPCKEMCNELVLRKDFPCSHKIKCSEKPGPCNMKCTATLRCGHRCRGTCNKCLNGRCHLPCDRTCHEKLVCGHSCGEKCGQPCPPCSGKCDRRCPHSACKHPCRESCKPCLQPCIWSCEHHKCTNLCSELCNRAPCDKPCPLERQCGHPCIGLCGETCPDKCRVCESDRRGRRLFSASADPQTARYIQLEDCGHIFEVNWLDKILGVNPGTESQPFSKLKVISCPHCRKRILSNRRYGNFLKKSAIDLQTVAEEVQRCQHNDGFIFRQARTVVDMAAYTLDVFKAQNTQEECPLTVDVSVKVQSSSPQVPPIRTSESNFEDTVEDIASVNSTNKLIMDELCYSLKLLRRDMYALVNSTKRLSDQQASELCAEINRITMVRELLQVFIERPNENYQVEKLVSILKHGSKLREKHLAEARSLLDQTYVRLEIDNAGHEDFLPFSIRHRPSWTLSVWQKCPEGHVVMKSQCKGSLCPMCEKKNKTASMKAATDSDKWVVLSSV